MAGEGETPAVARRRGGDRPSAAVAADGTLGGTRAAPVLADALDAETDRGRAARTGGAAGVGQPRRLGPGTAGAGPVRALRHRGRDARAGAGARARGAAGVGAALAAARVATVAAATVTATASLANDGASVLN